MVQPQDGDLSDSARAYIASLTSPHDREAAREYARMDPHAFQARIGPGLDELATGQAQILEEIRSGRRSISKKAAAGIVLAASAAVEGLLRGWERLR